MLDADPKRAENKINAILSIEDKELAACIPIGYPDQAPLPHQERKVRILFFSYGPLFPGHPGGGRIAC